MSNNILNYVNNEDTYFFDCPHCGGTVIVMRNQVNCKIFRHGIHKITNQQINPHASKVECDKLINDDLVFGCAKPFRLVMGQKPYAEICDYI